jgi:hypothetical protein
MKSTGYVIAAGALVLANDAIFVPTETGQSPLQTINWRVIPATAIMAVVLAGVESIAPEFGAGLGLLVLLSVLVIPVGNAPTPLENLAQLTTSTDKVALGK